MVVSEAVAKLIMDVTGQDVDVTPDLSNEGEPLQVEVTASGKSYTDGPYSKVTVPGDDNLVSGNIKSGVSIFGVAGNYSGSASYMPLFIVTDRSVALGSGLASAITQDELKLIKIINPSSGDVEDAGGGVIETSTYSISGVVWVTLRRDYDEMDVSLDIGAIASCPPGDYFKVSYSASGANNGYFKLIATRYSDHIVLTLDRNYSIGTSGTISLLTIADGN